MNITATLLLVVGVALIVSGTYVAGHGPDYAVLGSALNGCGCILSALAGISYQKRS